MIGGKNNICKDFLFVKLLINNCEGFFYADWEDHILACDKAWKCDCYTCPNHFFLHTYKIASNRKANMDHKVHENSPITTSWSRSKNKDFNLFKQVNDSHERSRKHPQNLSAKNGNLGPDQGLQSFKLVRLINLGKYNKWNAKNDDPYVPLVMVRKQVKRVISRVRSALRNWMRN